jgi:peptidoglycan/xylan/chitin deacetylase (PgdA/CDA1 family)
MRSGSLVLCYHAVTSAWEDPLATDPDAIEQQVKLLLARGYTAVTAEGALANRSRTLHVTFDDAFRNVTSVLDRLQRLGVPVTIFACSSLAQTGGRFRVPELRERLPADEDELLTMPFQMLRELAEQGVEIGSHTVSHPHLPQLEDDELLAELRDSRARMADELGRPCRFLAYPYGHHDARVQAATRAAGYEAAFTLDPSTGSFGPWTVPRVGVFRADSTRRFKLKTSRLRPPVMAARAELRARRA